MNDNEIWKQYLEFPFIEGSSLGRVRTRDRLVRNKNGKRIVKGRILKQYRHNNGYLFVSFSVNRKKVNRSVHRIIADCFIPNPDNLPQVNHKDCDRTNNNVSNLEWCDASYNNQYREKYGVSNAETQSRPLYAVNLKTLEVLRFQSRIEADRRLGINQSSIVKVIKGKQRTACGYWFTEDSAIEAIKTDKSKLRDIVAGKVPDYSVFVVNLNTLEVSRFKSQKEAGRALGIDPSSVTKVIKGKRNHTHGYWFTSADSNAVEATRNKLGDVVADKIEELMTNKEMQLA